MEKELPLLRLVIAGALGSMLGGLTLESIKYGRDAAGMAGWTIWIILLVSFGLLTQHRIIRGFFQTEPTPLAGIGMPPRR